MADIQASSDALVAAVWRVCITLPKATGSKYCSRKSLTALSAGLAADHADVGRRCRHFRPICATTSSTVTFFMTGNLSMLVRIDAGIVFIRWPSFSLTYNSTRAALNSRAFSMDILEVRDRSGIRARFRVRVAAGVMLAAVRIVAVKIELI